MAVQTDLYNFEEVGYDANDDDDEWLWWWWCDDRIKIIFNQTLPTVDMKEEEEKRKMDGMVSRVGTRVDAQGTQLDRTDPDLFDFSAEVIHSQRINSRYNVLP